MDSRIPKPGRIQASKAKENVSRNIGKLTTTTIANAMDLVKPHAAKLTTRSKTVEDIKAKLALTSKAAEKKAAATVRAPVVAGRKPPPKPAVAKPTAKAKPAAPAEKPKQPAKRIPPYDYKARFLDLKEKHDSLKEKYEKTREQLGVFEDLPDHFEQCKSELAQALTECSELQAEVEATKESNAMLQEKNSSLVETIQDLQTRVAHFEEYCPKLEFELQDLKTRTAKMQEENTRLASTVGHLQGELGLCSEQLFSINIERKNLHNEIMDLRGNIRVFCRVRPPLPGESQKRLCQWNYLDECSLEVLNLEGTKSSKHDFAFDHVFHQNSLQLDIFEMVAPLIQSALDGYNVCIFAYGQTGSGKTYTMDGVPENLGVIPRTVDLLFKAISDYRRLGWEYEIRAQFLEIYNEVLYDLLSNEDKKLEICMVSPQNKTDVFVTNLTEATVSTADDLRQLIHIAKTNRMTACTVGNERSSRSHAVTKITLIGKHEGKKEVCVGNINLVDLAGSESPKTSQRMDETKSINKSLSELSNVILALVQRNDHIPYRNSKLTHLLMPSLGGNSKTLMFVNVAPFSDCHAETVKSLRFASTVNSCKMAKVKKNRVLNTTAP